MIYLMFVLVVLMPVITVLSYRQGLSDCQKLIQNEPVKEYKPPDIEMTKEEIISNKIRQNIENYQGSGKGQIDIDDSGKNI